MKNKLIKYTKEAIKFVILLTIVLNIYSYFSSQDLNKENLKLQSVELLDGSTYTIKSDKPIIVHFWATWCPICKLEAANIQRVSEDYEVLTFAVQSGDKEEIQEYLKENKLNFKVVDDQNNFYSKQFKIKGFPTTFIYNKNKELKFTEVGYTSTLGLYFKIWLSKIF